MNARKMFRQLGYERAPEGTYLEDIVLTYRNYKKNITIDFYLDKKTFCKARGVIDCVQINCEEMQAITQQCKELGWLESESKQETNYEHFKDEIIENCMFNLAIVKGKPKLCNSVVYCSDCEFYVCKDNENNCNEKFKEWLNKPYEKPTFKLTQFEYDLLQLYKGKYSFKLSNSLRDMKEKGYFRSVDENAKIEDILESCEVIK